MLLQVQYSLRIFLWFLRVAIIIFVLIPGTIPALIVASLSYIISLLDPNRIVHTFLGEIYRNHFLVLPLWTQQIIFVCTALILLTGFIIREINRLEDPNILKSFRIKFERIYERYLKFPTE